MSFRGLLSAQSGKTELIVAFLAVLELMKMGSVVLKEAGDDDFILEASPELSENKEKLAEEIAGSLAFKTGKGGRSLEIREAKTILEAVLFAMGTSVGIRSLPRPWARTRRPQKSWRGAWPTIMTGKSGA